MIHVNSSMVHVNSFMPIRAYQLVDFNVIFQFTHFNSFIQVRGFIFSYQVMPFIHAFILSFIQSFIHPFIHLFIPSSLHSFSHSSFLHFNSFMSIPSCRFFDFILIHPFQFLHFMHFMWFQLISFHRAKTSYRPWHFFETSAPVRAGHYLVRKLRSGKLPCKERSRSVQKAISSPWKWIQNHGSKLPSRCRNIPSARRKTFSL